MFSSNFKAFRNFLSYHCLLLSCSISLCVFVILEKILKMKKFVLFVSVAGYFH